MGRLILVSNRLPVNIEKKKNRYDYNPSPGGLATGLASVHQQRDTLWIGWSGLTTEQTTPQDRKKIEKELNNNYRCHGMFISKREIQQFYSGFCNNTIWPLFHYFPEFVIYRDEYWESYVRMNQMYFEVVKAHVQKGDLIWIHDFHLMLLPRMIREAIDGCRIGFFLHIPFPSYEIFRLLPWREQILNGLIGADLVGFHIYDYMRHFISSVGRILGLEYQFGHISAGKRIVQVDAFPMGIDYEKFSGVEIKETSIKNLKKDFCKDQSCRFILSTDRLDYTKGIAKRLDAFDRFLEKYPKFQGKVTLICIAVPSRTSVEQYQTLKKTIDELVGKINGKYSTMDWMPVWYLYRSLPFEELTSLYTMSDVALVTPLRDGMNLIAKEYLATRKDGLGVLVLSETAGAMSELAETIIVNPNDREMVADAIHEALTMPEEEQRARNEVLQERLSRYNVIKWGQDFLDHLEIASHMQKEIQNKELSAANEKKIIQDYRKSKTGLIFLDYDGTLVPFQPIPEKAAPDEDLLDILNRLGQNKHVDIVLISGRDHSNIEEWFGDLPIHMAADHGLCIKEEGGDWRFIEQMDDTWKSEIRPILEMYVDRTPGSFIEEKSHSLAFHYRRSEHDLGVLRAMEIKDTLIGFIANLQLVLMEGKKVLEVRHGGANKGRAALIWTKKKKRDFIIAFGDDSTDEDLFEVLGDEAYTIKVGFEKTSARSYLSSHEEVRGLLLNMIGKH